MFNLEIKKDKKIKIYFKNVFLLNRGYDNFIL